MRTDVAIEKLCNVAPVVADLADKLSKDTEFKSFILAAKETSNNTVFLLKVLPLLLKNYAVEAYEILSIWNEKSVDEIKAQPFAETVKQIKALFADEDVRSFYFIARERGNVGRIVYFLDGIRNKMTLRAVVAYLDYRLKKEEESALFEIFVGEALATIEAGMRIETRRSYIDIYNRVWDIKKEVEDTRTAQEIIDDTFKKHGLTIKKHTEAVDESV